MQKREQGGGKLILLYKKKKKKKRKKKKEEALEKINGRKANGYEWNNIEALRFRERKSD